MFNLKKKIFCGLSSLFMLFTTSIPAFAVLPTEWDLIPTSTTEVTNFNQSLIDITQNSTNIPRGDENHAIAPYNQGLITSTQNITKYSKEDLEQAAIRYDDFHRKYEEILNSANQNPNLETLFDAQLCAQKMAVLSSFVCCVSPNIEVRLQMQTLADIFSVNQKILMSKYFMRKAIENPNIENWKSAENLKGVVSNIYINGGRNKEAQPFIHDYFIAKANRLNLESKWDEESSCYEEASKVAEQLNRYDLAQEYKLKSVIALSKIIK